VVSAIEGRLAATMPSRFFRRGSRRKKGILPGNLFDREFSPRKFCVDFVTLFFFGQMPIATGATSKLLATESQLTYVSPTVNEPVQVNPAPNASATPFLFPLSDVRAGVSVRIKQVSASPEVTNRLREMGFCEEQKIRLISRQSNLICQVCHARIGLNPKLAEKILVEALQSEKAA
jgi:Fe2+ transport system protein FeoA